MARTLPPWIIKFQKEVKRLRRIAKGNWYLHPQPSLSKLKKTGLGNCVAWSRLMTEIAASYRLLIVQLIIGEKYEYISNEDRHQITVIIDNNMVVWIQSNVWFSKFCKLRMVPTYRSLNKLLKRVARESGKKCNYTTGTTIYETAIKISGEL